MKAEELRIGNFVGSNLQELPENYFTMVEISEHACVLVDGLDQINKLRDRHYFECDDLEGIPLTPEWLERLGFKFVDMMFENVSMQYWRNDFLIVEQSKVVLLYNDKEVVTTVNVGYVHQLQNLYFALTGTELTLKP